MREELMEILACPVCKSELKLHVAEKQANEIVSGTLFCAKCDHTYEIKEGIPHLLPPDISGDQPG